MLLQHNKVIHLIISITLTYLKFNIILNYTNKSFYLKDYSKSFIIVKNINSIKLFTCSNYPILKSLCTYSCMVYSKHNSNNLCISYYQQIS